MKRLFISFLLTLLIATTSYADVITFSWLPNSESNLAGYKIYHFTEGVDPVVLDVGLPGIVDGRVVYTLPDQEYPELTYFYATAYNTEGQESDPSNQLEYRSPIKAIDGFKIDSVTIDTVNIYMSPSP